MHIRERMANSILFLTLKVFSASGGGIEKVCQVAAKAIYELGLQSGGQVKIFSMYDHPGYAGVNKYFPQPLFTGFGKHKAHFVLKSLQQGRKNRIVILSHINLLLVGYLIKKISPSTKVVLLAHGIEVWQPLPFWKKRMLHAPDIILPVSHFTKEKMKSLYGLPEERFVVINNCLDPFLEQRQQKENTGILQERYGLQKGQPVLLTVSRISGTERCKGYDTVIRALPELIKVYPGMRYLLAGAYDPAEKQRLDELIGQLGLKDTVIFTGFIVDEELPAHYKLATVFVMPGKKEGFGMVFTEAMFYGVPVIAGNKDGSVDALCHGELGMLVNPDNIAEIIAAVIKVLNNREAYLPDHDKLMRYFGYTAYKEKFRKVFERLKVEY